MRSIWKINRIKILDKLHFYLILFTFLGDEELLQKFNESKPISIVALLDGFWVNKFSYVWYRILLDIKRLVIEHHDPIISF